MAAGYPVLTVYVRCVNANLSGSVAEEIFAYTQMFYRSFGVELVMYGDAIENRPDISDWAIVDGVVDVELLCAREWQLGQYWVNVFFIYPLESLKFPDGSVVHLTGEHYSQHGSTPAGSGVVFAATIAGYWGVLAHELGHLFGLPHAFDGAGSPAAAPVSSDTTYNEVAMAPFEDETKLLFEDPNAFDWRSDKPEDWDPDDPLDGNLMLGTAPSFPWILPSQIKRIRLTITSRRGGEQVAHDLQDAFESGADPLSFIPLEDTPCTLWRSFL